jgi:hypothetical protein
MSVVIKYGGRDAPVASKTPEPTYTLLFGRILFLAEVSLEASWFAFGQRQIIHHDKEALNEALFAAQHFIVMLSIVSLFGELNKACKDGKCSRMHLNYTWLVPPIVAIPFDVLTLQKQQVFYKEDMFLRGLSISGVVMSVVTSLWTLTVIYQLKQYPRKSYLNEQ